MNREWISIKDGTEGDAAGKTITYADVTKSDDAGSSYADICYKMNGMWQIKQQSGDESYIFYDLAEAGTVSEAGAPMLLCEGLYITIPSGKKFKELEILDKSEMDIFIQDEILPVPEPVLETEEIQYIKDESIYNMDGFYPAVYAQATGQEQIMGIECVHIYVYPMHYSPKKKQIMVVENMKIRIWFEQDDCKQDTGLSNELPQAIQGEAFKELLLGYNNVYDLDSSNKPRMIIITTDELEYSMKIFEGVKTFTYNVEIVLDKDIYKKYPEKCEDEAILSFLTDEYSKEKISYVILGGDIDVIPTHKDKDGFASDSYYCTDGKTVVPRFALSRFPAKDKTQMDTQTDIASYYDRYYDETIRNTAVFTTYNRSDYENCKQTIAANMASSDFTVVKRYDGKSTKNQLIDSINQGAAFINYRGHGSETEWQSDIGLSTKDVPGLDVKRNTPIVLSIACSNNALYDKECFGVCWIRNAKAVAFLGASSPSYTTVNHYFDKYLWEAIYNEKLSVIGDIYLWATLKLYQNNKGWTTEVNIREYLLLGDASADYLADDITHK